VSFTRAKKKLIIIGSKSTLSADDRLLSDFFSLIEEKKWILDLPRGVTELHAQRPSTGSSVAMKVEVKRSASPRALKASRPKLSDSLVDTKPFIRDILNVSPHLSFGSFGSLADVMPTGRKGGMTRAAK
jgi:hypothetical protein